MAMMVSHMVALLCSALSAAGGCRYEYDDDHPAGTGCCVCISRFRDGEDIRRLPCGHAFHRDCVDRWLALCRRTCPLCRLHVGAATATAPPGLDEHLSDDLVIWFSSLFVAGL